MLLNHRKVGFLGAGHMAQAIIHALVESGTLKPAQVWASNRSEGKLQKLVEQYGIGVCKTNEELVDTCDIIVVGVKPQDLSDALEPIALSFINSHLVISLAAGITMLQLQALLPEVTQLVRIMPNTPVEVRRAVVGYCLSPGALAAQHTVVELLTPLGYLVQVDEGEPFQTLTVASGSGTGFVYELMQYWTEWLEEHGFDPQTARKMTVETFLGASLMAEKAASVRIQDLQDRVVSKKGVTSAGLQSMRELEIERALRYSFEKAVMRDTELSKKS